MLPRKNGRDIFEGLAALSILYQVSCNVLLRPGILSQHATKCCHHGLHTSCLAWCELIHATIVCVVHAISKYELAAELDEGY